LTADLAPRHVGCTLAFRVADGTALALQIAPATTAGELLDESLAVTPDGEPLATVDEVAGAHGGRTHVVHAGAGRLDLTYAATVDPAEPPTPGEDPGWDADAIAFLLQSRYCPSDALAGFAHAELGGRTPTEIAEWVHGRLAYTLGLSTPLTTAIETLGAGAGACRDFAHLTITLLRANGIPARLAAAYAPGLSPMDFHAVVEARVDGAWQVLDATRLAPRPTLVRIATGRDAADTAFATTLAGDAELLELDVTAWTDAELPADDHTGVHALS
jgi:transglutaminase-like putative cysteine protease